MQYSPYIDTLHFLVATFQGGVFHCSLALPAEEHEQTTTYAGHPATVQEVVTRRLHLSHDSFSYFCPSFPSQVVADDSNSRVRRNQPFLPYFDHISILQFDVNESRQGHLLVKSEAFGVQMIRSTVDNCGMLCCALLCCAVLCCSRRYLLFNHD
jgi:hypothetical protein